MTEPIATSFAAFREQATQAGITLPESELHELHRGATLLQAWLVLLRSRPSDRFVTPRQRGPAA